MTNPLIAPALLSGGANLIGGLFGASSARDINRQQIKLSREQMQFQERMSNTAYQRSTKDLEAAGLNRILALGSPSSSPGGAQPPSLKVPGEHIQRGISSALQSATLAAQLKLIQAQTEGAQNKADIDKPEAAVKGWLGNFLERSVEPQVNKIVNGISQTAKTQSSFSGMLQALEPVINKTETAKSAPPPTRSAPPPINLGPSWNNFKPSRSQESTYRELASPKENVRMWEREYRRTHSGSPSKAASAAYLNYLENLK